MVRDWEIGKNKVEFVWELLVSKLNGMHTATVAVTVAVTVASIALTQTTSSSQLLQPHLSLIIT